MKTIFGLVRLISGAIQFEGSDIARLRTDKIVRKGMGYVPQERIAFSSLTVMENLGMGKKRFEGEGKSLLANEEVRALYLGG